MLWLPKYRADDRAVDLEAPIVPGAVDRIVPGAVDLEARRVSRRRFCFLAGAAAASLALPAGLPVPVPTRPEPIAALRLGGDAWESYMALRLAAHAEMLALMTRAADPRWPR